MDSNQSGAVVWTIWDPFQGSLTNLGASGRLQSQIQAILGQILTFPDPLPIQSNFYGPKWVVQVSHTEYYICSTRTYWGHFRPSKVSLALQHRGFLCCYGSANFENTAFRSFFSNVLHEMCPMHHY